MTLIITTTFTYPFVKLIIYPLSGYYLLYLTYAFKEYSLILPSIFRQGDFSPLIKYIFEFSSINLYKVA